MEMREDSVRYECIRGSLGVITIVKQISYGGTGMLKVVKTLVQ